MTMLFSPLTLRGLTLKNRVVISPMCQYSAVDGRTTDWHFVHLGRFALGGAGLVIAEATAVAPEGRITHGDTGLWHDDQIEGFARITAFLKSNGAAAGIQLGHAGRKASSQRPWHGNGPVDDSDRARGEQPWQTVAPSALPVAEGWPSPREMTVPDIRGVVDAFAAAARRALRAGFDMIEIHGAHGYLLHEFLSPWSNKRTDEYGRDSAGRMRLPLEVVEAVRGAWPAERPLFMRVSTTDYVEGGLTVEDTVAFACELKARGVDVVDASSAGITGPATNAKIPRYYGHQVPFAERIRAEAGIATMAVGLIVAGAQAEAILRAGHADLIAVAREALYDPNWALHAQAELESSFGSRSFDAWPVQPGWWLERREPLLKQLGPWRDGASAKATA
ncbi:MAG TPA: NADH:flavin oxidoreductase/NADH oxidase [Alphaproteobacteria bacterium]|nr:NADH:flavin oxidoreductase/NADH oxidase [Alphaproteobacteria bacterium]